MKIERIVNEIYKSNTFVLSEKDRQDVWLVDCGDYHAVKNVLNGRKIAGVLLTHTHSDHIYGLNKLVEDFPEVFVYTNSFGRLALGNAKQNLSKYHINIEDFIINPIAKIIELNEGDLVDIFPMVSAKVLFTPGHDKSCLSYIIDKNLFTGDSYIPEVKVVASYPNSNKLDANVSYNRLVELSKIFRVYPGHGDLSF